MTVRLIMSGATVGQELAAEFGALPPAFLPVGVQRLYELQAAAFGGAGGVRLVLPETFHPSEPDKARLAALGLEVLTIPEGLKLGEAVIYALNSIGVGDEPVHILHGDTLVEAAPVEAADVFVGAARTSDYAWAELDVEPDGHVIALRDVPAGGEGAGDRLVATGYFAFASSLDLLRALTRMRGDFVAGLNHYAQGRRVTVAACGAWYDFGHLQTFFQSRLSVTTARAFNALEIDGVTARKSSRQASKIWAEAHWLQELPSDLQPYAVRLLGFGGDPETPYYETEYEFLPTLAELLVFGAVSPGAWRRILESCETFLTRCAAHTSGGTAGSALLALTAEKTNARLEQFARQSDIPIDAPLRLDGRSTPSLTEIAGRLNAMCDFATGRPDAVMHGDLGFSNILYDTRVRRIRVLDPRGLVGDRPTVFGDTRYDLAKLLHSVWGRYDQILAGRVEARRAGRDFSLAFDDPPAQAWLEDALKGLTIAGASGAEVTVRAVSAGLFLSMLPLHSDRPDRQMIFVANALRLFLKLDA